MESVKIEVGKSYRTRAGWRATVTRVRWELEPPFEVLHHGETPFSLQHTESGRYDPYGKNPDLDLIAPWPADSVLPKNWEWEGSFREPSVSSEHWLECCGGSVCGPGMMTFKAGDAGRHYPYAEGKKRYIVRRKEAKCVCGEPSRPGVHRKDGPCHAAEPVNKPREFKVGDWVKHRLGIVGVVTEYRNGGPNGMTVLWCKRALPSDHPYKQTTNAENCEPTIPDNETRAKAGGVDNDTRGSQPSGGPGEARPPQAVAGVIPAQPEPALSEYERNPAAALLASEKRLAAKWEADHQARHAAREKALTADANSTVAMVDADCAQRRNDYYASKMAALGVWYALAEMCQEMKVGMCKIDLAERMKVPYEKAQKRLPAGDNPRGIVDPRR